MKKSYLACFALCAAACLLCAGCGKLTKKNYDKLTPGMTFAQVQAVIGDPLMCSQQQDGRECVWVEEALRITVRFGAGKMLFKDAAGL